MHVWNTLSLQYNMRSKYRFAIPCNNSISISTSGSINYVKTNQQVLNLIQTLSIWFFYFILTISGVYSTELGLRHSCSLLGLSQVQACLANWQDRPNRSLFTGLGTPEKALSYISSWGSRISGQVWQIGRSVSRNLKTLYRKSLPTYEGV